MTYTYTFKDPRYGKTTMRAQSETPLHSLEKKNLNCGLTAWCMSQVKKGEWPPERLEGVVDYDTFENYIGVMQRLILTTTEGTRVATLVYQGDTRLED